MSISVASNNNPAIIMPILSKASDKDLFKDPPPKEDCPICFCPMAGISVITSFDRRIYLPCCRKMMCCGCFDTILDEIKMGTLKTKCVLCRMPLYSVAEMIESYKERIEANDVHAFNAYALGYTPSPWRPKTNEELELFKRGADIGSTHANLYLAEAYWYELWNNIADLLSNRLGLPRNEERLRVSYYEVCDILSRWSKKEGLSACGVSVVRQLAKLAHSSLDIAEYLARAVNLRDIEKAVYHYEIAAMGGNETARFWLGIYECHMGDYHRGFKHFMIAAKCGHDESLFLVREGYIQGLLTKDDYACALRAHQRSQDEIRVGAKAK